MKTLYLVRHAISSRAIPELKDIDRPLTEKGYSDAHLIAKELKRRKIKTDLIVTSHAIRAISTALIFAQALKYPYRNILINEKIYSEDFKEILTFIKEIAPKYASIMMFGHSPAFEELVNYISIKKIESFKTSGFICLEADKNASFEKGSFNEGFYLFPEYLEKA